MPITTEGLRQFARSLVNNTTLNLCSDENTPISGNNYQALTCRIGDNSNQGEAYFNVTTEGNTVTLTNSLFYFNDADDGTSSDPSTVLWSNINGLKFGNYYYGEFSNAPISVHLFERPKFAAGAITITFTSTNSSS